MSLNLLDLVKGQLTDEVVGKAASFLGESKESTETGLTNAIPALLGGVMSKASSKEGASDLLGMVTKPEVTGVLGNLTSLFGGSESGSNLGAGLLKGVLGDKLGGVTDLIGSVAGFKNSGSASGLLKMAAPLLMGVIGKQVGNSGVSGLTSLLAGQKEHLEKVAPAGLLDKLSSTLGVASLGGLVGGLTSSFTGGSEAKASTASTAKTSAPNQQKEPKKGGSKFWPILLLLAALAGIFFFWKSCGSDVKNVAGNVKDGVVNVAEGTAGAVADGANAVGGAISDGAGAVADGASAVGGAVVDGAEGAVNAVADGASAVGGAVVDGANAIYEGGASLVGKTVKGFEYLGEFFSRKLKNGTELVIPSKGFENNLVNFIESDQPVDKTTWFDLRRIVFKTGSAELDERSMGQIDNVVAILNAYPNVHLKIGGYTDNTGSAQTNKVVSAKRAAAVLNALVAKGIDKSRLASEGYGVEHPIASNDTAEGRALNRRVSARVTQK